MTPPIATEVASAEHFGLIRRMADDLAHELKNPLNSVVINLAVLRTRVLAGKTEGALDRLDVIDSEVRRLHLLLDRMLRLMRPDRAGVDTFPIDEVLGEAAGLAEVLAKLAGRAFVCEAVGDEVMVRSAREPLRLAVLMLAEAAIRAAPREGPPVRIHGDVDPTGVSVHVEAPAEAGPALREAGAAVQRLLHGVFGPLQETVVPEGCRVTLTLPRSA